MSEFENRIDAQRKILKIVNESSMHEEPLFSLSEKAIDRWIINNKIEAKSDLVLLIRQVSGKLFFLANKSQEQITEDYKSLSNEVLELTEQIQAIIMSNQKA